MWVQHTSAIYIMILCKYSTFDIIRTCSRLSAYFNVSSTNSELMTAVRQYFLYVLIYIFFIYIYVGTLSWNKINADIVYHNISFNCNYYKFYPLYSYNNFSAIVAHASASASAWWWFLRLYPQYFATVCSWWLGSTLCKTCLEALHVQ